VVEQRLSRKRLARDALNQIARGVPPAMPVNLLPQPVQQRSKFSGGEHRIKIANILSRLLEELGGVEIAERIGGKVADRRDRPVNVLKTALRIIRRRQTQIRHHLLVPCRGEVRHGQIARQHRLLQLVADENVQVIGSLIRFSADETRPNVIDRKVPLIE
jgi:hypothetical protein